MRASLLYQKPIVKGHAHGGGPLTSRPDKTLICGRACAVSAADHPNLAYLFQCLVHNQLALALALALALVLNPETPFDTMRP